MAGSRVPSALLSGAAALMLQLGAEPQSIAAQAGLDPEVLAHPDLPVAAAAAMDFLEAAAEATGCPTFGLRLGERGHIAAVVGPLWVLLRQARDIGQWCEHLAADFDLYTHSATLHFERHADGSGTLSWPVAAGVVRRQVQATEFALAICANEIRQHCPPGWRPHGARFRHAGPADLRDHRRIFGPNVQFNQDADALLLDAATLSRPLTPRSRASTPLLRRMLREHQDASMPRVLAAEVESLVRALLPYGPCRLADVCTALALPERTLQEHLQTQGANFKQILDAVRADLAKKYVLHSGLQLSEIAELLGYSEVSALSRSFRRWHGCSARSLQRGAGIAPVRTSARRP